MGDDQMRDQLPREELARLSSFTCSRSASWFLKLKPGSFDYFKNPCLSWWDLGHEETISRFFFSCFTKMCLYSAIELCAKGSCMRLIISFQFY